MRKTIPWKLKIERTQSPLPAARTLRALPSLTNYLYVVIGTSTPKVSQVNILTVLQSVDIPPVATLQLCGAMDFHQPCVDIAFFKHECQNTANVWPGHSILSARPMQSAWCYMYPVPDCLSLNEDGKRPIFLKWGISESTCVAWRTSQTLTMNRRLWSLQWEDRKLDLLPTVISWRGDVV